MHRFRELSKLLDASRRGLPALAFLAVSLAVRGGAAEMPAAPGYVGSASCGECHAEAEAAWLGSHHQRAWMLPSPASMLGDFEDAAFEHDGVTTRFTRQGDAWFVETEASDGQVQRYRVQGTAGVEPLQQYLVETEPGRLQALDVAWDTERGRWYHLYPGQHLPPGDGLHWTGPYKNWNARCAECHATGYAKNYDPATRRYASRQAEIGIGCEACHGPGEAHVSWAEDLDGYDAGRWGGLTPLGLTVGFDAGSAEAEIQQCAGCHSRREAFNDGNPLPGTPFHDAYRLALLHRGLYEADGAMREEVYNYGSFLQSKMYARGVRCSDCHEPHSLELRAEGNAVCTQCHSPAGNPRFPTLPRAVFDDPTHHFHPEGSPGAECTSCHMVERVYMGVDGRHDHSFRVPRPDLSSETGTADACTDCHQDHDPAWAAAEIARRFPESRHRGPHFSQAFAGALTSPGARTEALEAVAAQADLPGIVRATALDLMLPAANPEAAGRTAALLADPDPLVRAAAVPLQRAAAPGEGSARLAPLLRDPVRVVRMAAAREFIGVAPAELPPETAAAAAAALGEWRASMLTKADFPETHLALGGAALGMRDVENAQAAFAEAVRLDPQLVQAWSMIMRLHAATGDLGAAGEAAEAALAANPDDPAIRSMAEELRAMTPE